MRKQALEGAADGLQGPAIERATERFSWTCAAAANVQCTLLLMPMRVLCGARTLLCGGNHADRKSVV